MIQLTTPHRPQQIQLGHNYRDNPRRKPPIYYIDPRFPTEEFINCGIANYYYSYYKRNQTVTIFGHLWRDNMKWNYRN